MNFIYCRRVYKAYKKEKSKRKVSKLLLVCVGFGTLIGDLSPLDYIQVPKRSYRYIPTGIPPLNDTFFHQSHNKKKLDVILAS